MMQGWYYVESLTGQRHDRFQTESQIVSFKLYIIFGWQGFHLKKIENNSIWFLPGAPLRGFLNQRGEENLVANNKDNRVCTILTFLFVQQIFVNFP